VTIEAAIIAEFLLKVRSWSHAAHSIWKNARAERKAMIRPALRLCTQLRCDYTQCYLHILDRARNAAASQSACLRFRPDFALSLPVQATTECSLHDHTYTRSDHRHSGEACACYQPFCSTLGTYTSDPAEPLDIQAKGGFESEHAVALHKLEALFRQRVWSSTRSNPASSQQLHAG
jgi:hypothetical protein